MKQPTIGQWIEDKIRLKGEVFVTGGVLLQQSPPPFEEYEIGSLDMDWLVHYTKERAATDEELVQAVTGLRPEPVYAEFFRYCLGRGIPLTPEQTASLI